MTCDRLFDEQIFRGLYGGLFEHFVDRDYAEIPDPRGLHGSDLSLPVIISCRLYILCVPNADCAVQMGGKGTRTMMTYPM